MSNEVAGSLPSNGEHQPRGVLGEWAPAPHELRPSETYGERALVAFV